MGRLTMEYSFYQAEDQLETAKDLFEQGFAEQKQGNFTAAIALYRKSVEKSPSAEGYTYMGWSHSFLGDYEKAIRCCEKSIEVDPTYGNAYNDIGAYLIELGRYEEAIPWLKKAVRAPENECRHYPWYNLGKAFEKLGRLVQARDAYARTLAITRTYPLAVQSLMRVLSTLN